ncbi:comF family protein [Roseivivax halotolerans]|uniref:ComF family protein n=1 Tax=Roseivivax halotolerans TaxID=93684 RepID=A0A1I5V8K7_9RHOB|nr:ComF family protein [Roseivivax halotolerans]SFQ03853.1 comF family protein [Roseivivax halotolerans]
MPVAAVQTVLDLVFPPRCLSCGGFTGEDGGLCGPCWRDTPFITGLVCKMCGVPLPGRDAEEAICDDCLRIARPWTMGRAALLYTGVARDMVLKLKHGDRHDIIAPAARWMLRSAAPLISPDTCVVPVPLHTWRLIRRRFNQSALLAQELGRQGGMAVVPDALRRIRATPSLDGRTREERFAALDGAIVGARNRASRIAGRDVLLVDDVMTSGATFAAATEALHAVGAQRVCVLALARVAKNA